MLSPDQLKICNELVQLYKAQLPLVEPTDSNPVREWTHSDIELYDSRAERIATLQRQLLGSVTTKMGLKASRLVQAGSWGDR